MESQGKEKGLKRILICMDWYEPGFKAGGPIRSVANIVNALKDEFESELWASGNYYFILAGYTVLVALVLIMLFLFLKKYRNQIFENNVKVTFIFFNVLFNLLISIFLFLFLTNLYIYKILRILLI